MSGREETSAQTISLELAKRIDEISDQFETSWREERKASIVQFLEGWNEPARSALLEELVSLELGFRRSQGETPQLQEYQVRFPEHADLLATVFNVGESEPPTTAGASTQIDLRRPEERKQRFEEPSQGNLFGNYEIVQEIARGGMGIVYKAIQLSTQRTVALKIIRPDRMASIPADQRNQIVQRFQQEARAAAQLEHPHLVSVYEVGEAEGRHFYSMQLVEGQSLDELVAEGPIDNRQSASYLEPVARAVHHAHLHHVLHRDLKPHNVLLDRNTRRTLVADFGLAKLRDGDRTMTETGDIFGAPPYMAPEQAQDAANVTASADIYSLGATLYHLITGRPPFQASNVAEVLRQVLNDDPVPPSMLNPTVDTDLETICLKCLEKEPERRYATSEALANELRRYLNGEPIEARPLGHVGRTWRWSKRNPGLATVCGAWMLTLLLGTCMVVVQQFRISDQQTDLKNQLAEVDRQRDELQRLEGQLNLQRADLERSRQDLENKQSELDEERTLRMDLELKNVIQTHRSTEELVSLATTLGADLDRNEEMLASDPANHSLRRTCAQLASQTGAVMLPLTDNRTLISQRLDTALNHWNILIESPNASRADRNGLAGCYLARSGAEVAWGSHSTAYAELSHVLQMPNLKPEIYIDAACRLTEIIQEVQADQHLAEQEYQMLLRIYSAKAVEMIRQTDLYAKADLEELMERPELAMLLQHGGFLDFLADAEETRLRIRAEADQEERPVPGERTPRGVAPNRPDPPSGASHTSPESSTENAPEEPGESEDSEETPIPPRHSPPPPRPSVPVPGAR